MINLNIFIFHSKRLFLPLPTVRLVPNTTLKFAYEGASKSLQEFIKEELLMLVQSL